jgi:DNA invertase Pin-like site-specific DNA recombinase
MLIGYARVSKSETQDTAPQIRTLKDAGCTRLFEEAASGGRCERPELHKIKMLDQLRYGDTLIVWKLDRLSPNRSTRPAPPAGRGIVRRALGSEPASNP